MLSFWNLFFERHDVLTMYLRILRKCVDSNAYIYYDSQS